MPVMSVEMTIPAVIHRAKGTLNEPSSITGGSVAQRADASHECQLWTEERNAYAKEVMTDIEAQRKQRRKAAR